MQGQIVAAGMVTTVVSLLIVAGLSVGFGVSMAQAVGQALPAILVSGSVVALTTLILRNEPV